MNGTVIGVEIDVYDQRRFLDVGHGCKVVLSASAIESTRLALLYFPTPLMGRNLMAQSQRLHSTDPLLGMSASPWEKDEYIVPRAYVQLQTAAADHETSQAIDEAALSLAAKLASQSDRIEYPYAGAFGQHSVEGAQIDDRTAAAPLALGEPEGAGSVGVPAATRRRAGESSGLGQGVEA